MAGAFVRGMSESFNSGVRAASSAAKDKAIGSPGAYAGSILGLANAKLEQSTGTKSGPTPPEPKNKNRKGKTR